MTETRTEGRKFRRGAGRVLLITCGALAREGVGLIEANGWHHLDVRGVDAHLHHRPALIPDAVRGRIREARGRYRKIYVVYGDCGTAGALDRMLAEEGVERIAGPHCFAFYMGNQVFEDAAAADMTSFYLTDFFCRHFETFVWRALGLDRAPRMAEMVFGNYQRIVYLAQTGDADLLVRARDIAERLGLAFEVRYHG